MIPVSNLFLVKVYDFLNSIKQNHTSCEDPFYNCPKCEEGTGNDLLGTECTCGADNFNKKVDELLIELRNIAMNSVENPNKDIVLPSKEEILKEAERQVSDFLSESTQIEQSHYIIGFRKSFEYICKFLKK